ncbi:MAG TPA: hypothetical protein DCW68_01435 [Rhodospirillaceae bacterium]|nr:MAG: hypothetical protein A2018_04400 [Alphaproteobacteria bacterium GWF2_58_20]HAU28760.1 hypothetical protein [Rhodospirillaceae bacterium]
MQTMIDDTKSNEERRLGGQIASALKIAVEQKDVEISEILLQALELAMTRASGGEGFIEKRDFPHDLQEILQRLDALRHLS